MVGRIISVTASSAFTTLRILDDSGEIDVKIWRQDNDEVIARPIM